MHKNEPPADAKKIVVSFQESLNNGDLKSARSYVSDDFLCTNPLGSFDSAESYFKAAEKAKYIHEASYKFELKKIFIDDNDVCVFNNVIAGPITLFACGWYHVEDHKIHSLKLVYDPRPLLQKKE
jgi:ketosteroid isomerase-like protein